MLLLAPFHYSATHMPRGLNVPFFNIHFAHPSLPGPPSPTLWRENENGALKIPSPLMQFAGILRTCPTIVHF
jgi:hypothetical protein